MSKHKFQVGDRVIRCRGNWMKSFRGTVVGHTKGGNMLIELDPEFKGKVFEEDGWGWNPMYVELEEVYDSPLWRALE